MYKNLRKIKYARTNKSLKLKLIAAFCILFFSINFSQTKIILTDAQTGTNLKMVGKIFENETMTVSDFAFKRDLWTDDQWEFYKLELELGQSVLINMSYTGVLDLDLRLYIDEVHPTAQDNLAWDITHCGIKPDLSPTRNSQIRGYNATETVYYTNQKFVQKRIVYVLVFVYTSLQNGSSTYTINSNITMQRVKDYELQQCFGVKQAYYTFFGAIIVSTAAILYLGHRAKSKEQRAMKEKQKKKVKSQKVVKKKEKKVKKAKKISMKKRMGK
ncbi:MAG: hypothetical protein ACTSU2_00650 [Promethearchaeota archaeon]